VFVGSDFRFGMDQAGDTRYLTSAGERFGFSVNIVEPVLVDGKKAGSSRVRELIHAGAVTEASKILERPFALVGRVVAGKQLGRKLGFPTANVETKTAMAIPADGVYAVRVWHDGQRHMGACSIGFRPTVQGTERTVEVYLLDFDGDLYGKELEVEFISRIRDELEFHSLDDLVKQMHDDVSETRRILQELA
jgi:riboflavin kinase/FMN adenylyltransferase